MQTSRPVEGYVPEGDDLPNEARADYREAVLKEYAGDRARALELLEDLSRRYPLRLAFHLRQLRLAIALNGPEYAARLYDPPPPGMDQERAGVLVTLARLPEEDLEARYEVLSFAAQREPSEPWWHLALADVALSAHDVMKTRSERERELGRVQAADELRAEAEKTLGEARVEAEAALKIEAGLAEAETLLGYIETRHADLLEGIEKRDEARAKGGEHYRKALEYDPENLPALLNMAENEIYFDRYEEAAKLLRLAVDLAPAQPLAWNNLGYSYYAGGRLSDAKRCYEKALELEPHDANVRTAYADTLRRLDESPKAVKELEQAREDAGEDRELLGKIAFKLAAIHEHEQRYRMAVAEYQRYIALGGRDSAKARSRIRHIYRHAFE